MSYGIIRIAKYKKGAVKGLQIHDQREKEYSHSNADIDFEKSNLNYDLHNAEHINFTAQVNERIRKLDFKKAVRHDAVVMCQCLITSGNEFFENMNAKEQNQFFKDAYGFICDRYGKQNIISATVHFDERTPHMHVNFVPVTSDGRLSAFELFKKKDLTKLHDDFYKFNNSKGYRLERGEGKEGFQKHLTTEEFKLKVATENLERVEQERVQIHNACENASKTLQIERDELESTKTRLIVIRAEYEAKKAYTDKSKNDITSWGTLETKMFSKKTYVSVPSEKWSKISEIVEEKKKLEKMRSQVELNLQELEEMATGQYALKLTEENERLKRELEKEVRESKRLELRLQTLVSEKNKEIQENLGKWQASYNQLHEEWQGAYNQLENEKKALKKKADKFFNRIDRVIAKMPEQSKNWFNSEMAMEKQQEKQSEIKKSQGMGFSR